MQLRSSAFRAGGQFLFGTRVRARTSRRSFLGLTFRRDALALIIHDPDAPREGGFTHWLVYDIDPALKEIEENTSKQERSASVGRQGKNDSGKVGYMGPCPPSGSHRYIARLFALDNELNLKPGASHEEVASAMQGHVLAEAALMGRYAKKAAA